MRKVVVSSLVVAFAAVGYTRESVLPDRRAMIYGRLTGEWMTSYGKIERRVLITKKDSESSVDGTRFWLNVDKRLTSLVVRQRGLQTIELGFIAKKKKIRNWLGSLFGINAKQRFASQVVGFIEFRGRVHAILQTEDGVELYRADSCLRFGRRPIATIANTIFLSIDASALAISVSLVENLQTDSLDNPTNHRYVAWGDHGWQLVHVPRLPPLPPSM